MIVDEYLGNTDDPAELRDGFLELLGDLGIVIPSIRALNYYRGELMNTNRILKPFATCWIKQCRQKPCCV